MMLTRRFSSLIVASLLVAVFVSGCTLPGPIQGKGQPGAWGVEFLSSKSYTSLLIEIDYESGAQPASEALQALEDAANRYLDKPGGIRIESQQMAGKGKGAKWTFDEIRAHEDVVRTSKKAGSEAALHIMYVNGGSSSDTDQGSVLGAAYTGSSIVMFKDNIRNTRNNCPLGLGCPSSDRVEHAVMVHELGHILGLVNNGIPMQSNHEDPEHEGHSINERSVMYWKVETGNIFDLLAGGGSLPLDFDADDRADMRAAGGK